MKKIYIKTHDFGFWTEQPISFKRKEDDEVVFCNHDGAVEEVQENEMIRPEGPDISWTSRVLICECGAYKMEGDSWWQDAPFEGKHYE